MHILYDADEHETIVYSRPCTTCDGFLSKCRGVGCNGSGGIGSRRRSPEEVKTIKAERQRTHEDAILAEAAEIMARRNGR